MRLLTGDCLERMRELPDCSVDCICTDPPYGLSKDGRRGFMGKEWDRGVPGPEYWREALRVAKPGCWLTSFGGTRTHHRLTAAIEDAGWEIRDCLMWLYGTGMPKGLDISKALDKQAGAERKVVGVAGRTGSGRTCMNDAPGNGRKQDYLAGEYMETLPATDLARLYDGYNVALKPSYEPIVLARKPLPGTVAQNVQQYGTGGLNIDATRIPTDDNLNDQAGPASLGVQVEGRGREVPSPFCLPSTGSVATVATPPGGRCRKNKRLSLWRALVGGPVKQEPGVSARRLHFASARNLRHLCRGGRQGAYSDGGRSQLPGDGRDTKAAGMFAEGGGRLPGRFKQPQGRWPPNVLLSHTLACTDEACDPDCAVALLHEQLPKTVGGRKAYGGKRPSGFGNVGADKGTGRPNAPRYETAGSVTRFFPRFRYSSKASRKERGESTHPTVKPQAVVEWLLRLIAPPGRPVVLDPFMGSGTTGIVAVQLGFRFIGIDREPEFVELARRRIAACQERSDG
jgi:DNA modification methylase